VDFTREPIIETIITPREGYRLVVRSSKNMGQEEHFVDAIEVVSFGSAFFFRSLERPKPFVVPVADYEVLEVREPRMVLKTTPVSGGSVKIGGGRESGSREGGSREPRESYRQPREKEIERKEVPAYAEGEKEPLSEEGQAPLATAEGRPQGNDRRRDRRRGFRRRRGGAREEGTQEGQARAPQAEGARTDEQVEGGYKTESASQEMQQVESSVQPQAEPTLFRSILPPPTTLIRDDLQRLRESEVYRGAFFIREEGAEEQDDDDATLESSGADFSIPKEEFAASDESKDKEASSQEEPFLFSQAVDEEAIPNHPQE
jgi:hypothetical protein